MSKQIPTESFELDGFQASAVVRALLDRIQKVEDELEDVGSEEAESDLKFLRSTYLRTVRDVEKKMWEQGRIQDEKSLHVYYPGQGEDLIDVEVK